MKAFFQSNNGQARLAAGLFFLICWPTARLGTGYSHSNFLVSKDAAATANNLLSNESMFRIAVASHLVSVVVFLVMVLIFYRLFSPFDKHLSRMMVVPAFLQLVFTFMLEVLCFISLLVIKDEVSTSLDESQKQDLVYLALRSHVYANRFYQAFLGLWLTAHGILVYKSRFAPRIIAVLTIIGAVCFVVEGGAFILLQRPGYLAVMSVLKFSFLLAFSSHLWFLIMGIRPTRSLSAPLPA